MAGCTSLGISPKFEGCKRHTYINLVLSDYLKQRYDSQAMTRMAIIPFDVPETFAPPGNESINYGRELARKFQLELHATGAIPIVELFNRDRWPGKHEEFFTGNYRAIELARAAGYDLVMVGYLEPIKDATTMTVYTKIIDTQSQITVWNAQTLVYSDARTIRTGLSKMGLQKDRPELFYFPERTDQVAACTVDAIINEEPVP